MSCLALLSVVGATPARAAWEISDILPVEGVSNIAQADDGALWVATAGGVYRHDGFETRRVIDRARMPVCPGGKRVFASRNAIFCWVSGQASILAFAAGEVREGARFATGDIEVRALASGQSGRLVVATNRGVFDVEPGSGPRELKPIAGTEHLDALALVTGPTGALIVGHRAGVARLDTDGVMARLDWVKDGEPVQALARHRNTIWIASGERLAILHGAEPQWQPMPPTLTPAQIAVDPAGRLWVADDQRLAVLDDRRFEFVAPASGPGLGTILSLATDHEGNVWIASRERGLLKVSQPLVRSLTAAELGQGELVDLARGPDDRVWIAGDTSFVALAPSATIAVSPGRRPLQLVPHPDGTVWALSSTHLSRPPQSPATAIARAVALPRADALSMAVGHDGAIWVTWAMGGASRLSPIADAPELTIVRTHDVPDGTCEGPFTRVIARRRGGAWLASGHGLSRVDENGRATCLTSADGLPDNHITTLLETPDDALWLGTRTHDAGLIRLRGARMSALTEEHGLPCDTIRSLAADGDGNLWFACPAMVARASLQDLDRAADSGQHVDAFGFDKSDGVFLGEPLPGGGPSLLSDGDRRLWILTREGISTIEDLRERHQLSALPPEIGEIRVSDVPRTLGHARTLRAPVGNGLLSVTLDLVRLSFPARTWYRAFLRGRSDGWWYHYDRVLLFHDVPPGEYELQVAASNGFGRWSPATTYRIELQPPFIGSRTFVASVIAAIVLAGLGLHHLRLRQVRYGYRQQQQERERLARDLHDGLAQGVTTLGLQLDALRREIPDTASRATEIARHTRELLSLWHAEIRKMIWNLRANRHAMPSIDDAIARAVKNAVAAAGPGAARPTITIDTSGAKPLSGSAAHEFPFIIQEAVTNAIRHAGANTIEIRISASESELLASVQDDGKGMPESWDAETLAAAGHFGLMGMYERARRAGGYLEVQSDGNRGTRVLVVIPFEIKGDRND